MNQRSDIDSVLRQWLDDGPTAMPDRIIDVVADRISVEPQRRSWRLLRRLPMNSLLKLGAAAAAVLVIAVVAWQALPRNGGVGGQPTPSPTPTTALLALSEGPLTAGRYRFQPSSSAPDLTIAADVPAGWHGTYAPSAVLGPFEWTPRGIAVVFLRADGLHRDPCHWDREGNGQIDQPGDVVVGPAAIDLVNALQASSSYTSTDPSPVTLGAYQGYEMEIQRPAGVDLAECDSGVISGPEGHFVVFSGPDTNSYAQGQGNRLHLFIADVKGTRVIAAIRYFDETPATDVEAARTIVDSVEFIP